MLLVKIIIRKKLIIGGLSQSISVKTLKKNELDEVWITLYQAYFKKSLNSLTLNAVFNYEFLIRIKIKLNNN